MKIINSLVARDSEREWEEETKCCVQTVRTENINMYQFTLYWIILIALKWFFFSVEVHTLALIISSFSFLFINYSYFAQGKHTHHTPYSIKFETMFNGCVCALCSRESAYGFWMINHLWVVVVFAVVLTKWHELICAILYGCLPIPMLHYIVDK